MDGPNHESETTRTEYQNHVDSSFPTMHQPELVSEASELPLALEDIPNPRESTLPQIQAKTGDGQRNSAHADSLYDRGRNSYPLTGEPLSDTSTSGDNNQESKKREFMHDLRTTSFFLHDDVPQTDDEHSQSQVHIRRDEFIRRKTACMSLTVTPVVVKRFSQPGSVVETEKWLAATTDDDDVDEEQKEEASTVRLSNGNGVSSSRSQYSTKRSGFAASVVSFFGGKNSRLLSLIADTEEGSDEDLDEGGHVAPFASRPSRGSWTGEKEKSVVEHMSIGKKKWRTLRLKVKLGQAFQNAYWEKKLAGETQNVDTIVDEAAARREKQTQAITKKRDKNWDLFMAVLALYATTSATFDMAFHLDGVLPNYCTGLCRVQVSTVLDAIFLLDIVISLLSPVKISDPNNPHLFTLSKEWKDIWRVYARRWLLLDLVSSVPVELIGYLAGKSGYGETYGWLKMLKVLRLMRVRYLIGLVEGFVSRWISFAFKCFSLLLAFAMQTHFLACFYYVIARWQGFENSWVAAYDLMDVPVWDVYFRALLYSICTASALGLPSDLYPTTKWEFLFAALTTVMGIVMNTLIIGTVFDLITIMNSNVTAWYTELDAAKRFMEKHMIPSELRSKWLAHWQVSFTQNQLSEQQFMSKLPPHLQDEMNRYLCREILTKVPIFQMNRDLAFEDAVLRSLVRRFVCPGDIVVREGEVGNGMYFLAQGSVEVFCEDRDNSGDVVQLCVLKDGTYFGERSSLTNAPTTRNSSVRGLTHCDLYFLPHKSLRGILQLFPAQEKKMLQWSTDREAAWEKALLKRSLSRDKAPNRDPAAAIMEQALEEVEANKQVRRELATEITVTKLPAEEFRASPPPEDGTHPLPPVTAKRLNNNQRDSQRDLWERNLTRSSVWRSEGGGAEDAGGQSRTDEASRSLVKQVAALSQEVAALQQALSQQREENKQFQAEVLRLLAPKETRS